MSIVLSTRSRQRLSQAHPDLQRVFVRAAEISDVDFTILEVLRTVETQRAYVAKGASRTMKSRHLPHPSDGLSRAVDIAPWVDGQVSWAWPLYRKLAPIIKQAARDVGVPIEWGGDWRTFKDGPHWQLPWKTHP